MQLSGMTWVARDGAPLSALLASLKGTPPHAPLLLWLHDVSPAAEPLLALRASAIAPLPGGALLYAGYRVLHLTLRVVDSSMAGEAGPDSWRRPMDDVMSAVESYLSTYMPHSEQRGLSARIGMLGHGFAGFVALQVLAAAPDRFAVGVTLGGVCAEGVGTRDLTLADGSAMAEAEEAREGEGFGRLQLSRLNAPLLLLHGERDERCSVSRAKAICQAVFARGVPTQLVLYPGGARVLEHPVHRRDAARRVCAWLLTHMPPATV